MTEATYNRLKAMRHAELAAAELARRVKESAEKPRTHDEHVRDATAGRIAELQSKLKGLLLPAEREQFKRRLEILKQGHSEVDATIKEDKRVERFRSDPSYVNAKEHFSGFSKNPAVKGVTAEQIALCGAILDSTSWENPAAAATAYWQEVYRAEEAAHQQANSAALDAQTQAYKAEHVAALAKVAELERGQAVAQARANLGAADAP